MEGILLMEEVFLMEGCDRLCTSSRSFLFHKLGTMSLGTPLEVLQSTVTPGISSISWKVKPASLPVAARYPVSSDLGLTRKNPLLGMC